MSSQKIGIESHRLTFINRFAYGIGSHSSIITFTVLGFHHQPFVLQICQIEPLLYLLLSLSGRVWDAITDPIIGYLVSITDTRFGKMRPWLFYNSFLVGISFSLLFYCIGTEVKGAFCFYFFSYLLFQLLMTMYYMPYTSYVMMITNSPSERHLLVTHRVLNESVAMIVGNFVFMKISQIGQLSFECENIANTSNVLSSQRQFSLEQRQNERFYYSIASSVVGIWCILTGLFCTIFVPEYSQDRSLSSSSNSFNKDACDIEPVFRKKLVTIVKFAPYRTLALSYLLSSIGIQSIQLSFVYYIQYSLKMIGYQIYMILALLISASVMIPVAYCLSRAFGKRRTYTAACVLIVPAMVACLIIHPKPHLGIVFPLLVYSGFCLGTLNLLPWTMLPDAIQEFISTKDMVIDESIFYSLFTFLTKLAMGCVATYQTIILKIAKYDVMNRCYQPEDLGLYLQYSIFSFSILCFMGSIISLYFYPIDERQIAKKGEFSDTGVPSSPNFDLLELPRITISAAESPSRRPSEFGSWSRRVSNISQKLKLSKEDLRAWSVALTGQSGVSTASFWNKKMLGLKSKLRRAKSKPTVNPSNKNEGPHMQTQLHNASMEKNRPASSRTTVEDDFDDNVSE